MKIARSALFLFAPTIACFAGVVAVACSNSSSTPGTGEDSGAPPATDSGSASDTSVADTGAAAMVDSSTSLPTDAGPHDTGTSGNDDASEAAAAPTCGPAPDRYTLLSDAGAQLADAGVGLVEDNTTGLVWMSDSVGGEQTQEQTQTLAANYCSGIGMRLPTQTEALGIAVANYAACAFGPWSTWTSTATPSTPGDAQTVDYLGDVYPQLADNYPNGVLCVRGGSADQ